MGHFSIEREDGNVAVVIFKNHEKELNTLSESVIRELDKVIDKLAEDSTLQGVVFMSGRPDQFIVGADIDQFSAARCKRIFLGMRRKLGETIHDMR